MMGVEAKDIVLYSTQRSGTHFVSSLLASVDQRIVALGEVFRQRGELRKFVDYLVRTGAHGLLDGDERRLAVTDLDPKLLSEQLGSFLEDQRPHPEAVLTMIWMYNHLGSMSEAARLALFEGRPIVHLVRRNVLRTHVSDHINRAGLKAAHLRPGDAPTASGLQVELPTAGLRRKLRRRRDEIQKQRAFLENIPHIELFYEDVDLDPGGAINDVATRLGLATGDPRTGLRKSNPQTLRELLANFDDVERILAPSSFAAFLDS